MDYKFSKYIEHTDGSVEATVRFYNGEVTTENEKVMQEDGSMVEQPVTRYRRTALVEEVDYVFKDVESVKI
jgi:hypothetical protein